MELMIFKFAPASSLTAIWFVQKLTNADGNLTTGGGYEDLIKSGDHIEF
jgi:hypothetical protein